ncbi:MAG: hypothetical protein IAE81_19305 [Caldilineaceae bacterium]|jgi:hypothetical protein|nr:hypothetical protein [Caldilineaceae bacterium]
MNPLQQMELARIDHQERLQQSQRHQAANQFEQTLQWSLPLFSQRKQAAANNAKPASIWCDTVIVR